MPNHDEAEADAIRALNRDAEARRARAQAELKAAVEAATTDQELLLGDDDADRPPIELVNLSIKLQNANADPDDFAVWCRALGAAGTKAPAKAAAKSKKAPAKKAPAKKPAAKKAPAKAKKK